MNLKRARARKQPDAINSQNLRVGRSNTHHPSNAYGMAMTVTIDFSQDGRQGNSGSEGKGACPTSLVA